jgi:aminopeptidase N
MLSRKGADKGVYKLVLLVVLFILLFITFQQTALAQSFKFQQTFTRHDTLRGSLGPGRTWWDVTHYDVWFKPNPADSTISGTSGISFKVTGQQTFMQVDLQQPLRLDSAFLVHPGGKIESIPAKTVKRDSNCLFFKQLPALEPNSIYKLVIKYHGRPRLARFPPWDGGLIWRTSASGAPWISIACQGLGASVWYPCKDHQSDEPDSAALHITCPDTLVGVGNGRLRGKTKNPDKTTTWHWAVTSPINSYCIIPYIGKYTHFGDLFNGEQGALNMDYWVLEENLEKAKKQFADAVKMMVAFEHWFGPYPFYKDSYKLVEAPHLGMEHQSATAYGNGYKNGYYGRDLSGTGWGLKWDFIIVHESGHEWFANNITTKDIADMWVHEGFTNYSETLFTDYYFGTPAGNEYCRGLRKNIMNDKPVIGPYGVNQEGSGDMYNKGANMIHILRQLINDDEKFRSILRGLNSDFRHSTVTSRQVEEYISLKAGRDFSKIFDQYLRTTKIPVLQYKIKKGALTYQWTNCVEGFNMPVKVKLGDTEAILLNPTDKPQALKLKGKVASLAADPNFYIRTERLR